MRSEILVAENQKRVVVEHVEASGIHFFGFVKSNINMTQKLREIAGNALEILYKEWNDYERFSNLDDVSFRKESLKKIRTLAKELVSDGTVDPSKEKLSLTAVCVFPYETKSFWINTGSDTIYSYEGRRLLWKLTKDQKYLMKFRHQSIFSDLDDYEEKSEGGLIDTPVSLILVSAEAKLYFESVRGFVVKETFDAFALGKKNPVVIAEIFAD